MPNGSIKLAKTSSALESVSAKTAAGVA